jgi:hypothetical protein
VTIFDLVFIALFLISIGTLAVAAIFAVLGRRARAIGILKALVIVVAIYCGIVILVSLVAPRRVLSAGEPLCFDDWCITVEGAEQTASQSEASYVVRLRLSSRARRATQRENGVVVYLTDANGTRYDPVSDLSAVPLNVQLQPMESVITTHTFKLPADAPAPSLVIAHEGRFPIDWFIIGGGPFRKQPIVRLDEKETP